MKTKFLSAAFLLLGVSMSYGQLVQSSTETGVGTENGAYLNTTSRTVFIGYQAGKYTTAGNNTYVGHGAGSFGTGTGNGNNCFFGESAGKYNSTGESNVFMGSSAGLSNNTGSYNMFIGTLAGANTTNGNSNLFMGHGSGATNINGGGNVYLGFVSGGQCTGSGNIFIGSAAGSNVTTANNKLYIANSGTSSPTIYGDFSTNKVAIGGFTPLATSDGFPTTSGSVNVTNFRLFVTGGILTEEVRVHLRTGWADYVFNNDYKLLTLPELEQYISKNGHLPNVPSAERIAEDGIGLGEMSKIQQEKIEELTLYAIEQDKKVEAQKLQLEQQQKEIDELKAAVKVLMQKQ